MKAVTANRLSDGVAIYLDADLQWVEDLAAAARFEGEAADAALAAAEARPDESVGPYLMDVSEDGAPAGRARLRETIRATGPTVRLDLGKQAEAR